MCSCLCTWRGDYTFKQSDHHFTSALCNYNRIRMHSKCKDTPSFKPYPALNNIACKNRLVLSLVISFWRGKGEKNEYIKGMGGWGGLKWRDNHFFFKSMKIRRVKVIMGCRQWEERHSELISLANREPPCFDPSVGFSLCLRAHHTMSSVAN